MINQFTPNLHQHLSSLLDLRLNRIPLLHQGRLLLSIHHRIINKKTLVKI